MRRTLRLAFGAAVILAAGSALAQPSAPNPAPGDYLPLKAGTRWVYKIGDSTIEVKVSDATKDGAKLDTVMNGKTVASEQVEAKADGLYRTKINTTPIEPPVRFFPLENGKAAAKGFKWKVDSKVATQGVKGEFVVKDDKEKVKVPLGEYEAVVVDGAKFEIAGTETAVKSWFVPGKGIVKLSYSISGNEAVLELKEFTEGK